jgi:hypothetical protein
VYRFWDVEASWGAKRLLALLATYVLTLVELVRKVFPKRAESIKDVAGKAMSETRRPAPFQSSPRRTRPSWREHAARGHRDLSAEIPVPAKPSLMSGICCQGAVPRITVKWIPFRKVLVAGEVAPVSGDTFGEVRDSAFRVVMRLFEGFTFGRLVPFRCRAPPPIRTLPE